MQNVMSVPSAARVSFQGFRKLLALHILCLVLKLFFFFFFLQFCALFSAIMWVRLDFIGIYGVTLVEMGVILCNMGYQRGNRVVML